MIKSLNDFLNFPIMNAWVPVTPHLEVYVRKSKRYLEGKMVDALDVANMTDMDEERRGKGVFTAFLVELEARAKELGRVVYVENLLNERLLNFFLKRGYVSHEGTVPPSVYKSFLVV